MQTIPKKPRDRTEQRPKKRQTLRDRLAALVARYATTITAIGRAVLP